MRRWVVVAAAVATLSAPAGAGWSESRTVYVNCDGAAGDGSWGAPFDSITAALPSARALSATYRVTVDVRGVCDAETFPLVLDFDDGHLRGHGLGKFDLQGWPLAEAWTDTVIVRPAGTTTPLSMIKVTADRFRVSRISLDGGLEMPADNTAPPPTAPIGIHVLGSDGFSVEGVRVGFASNGVRADASRGTVANSYLGPLHFGALAVFGALPPVEATVVAWNNRILFKANGIATAGGVSSVPALGTEDGTHVSLHLWRNDIGSLYSNTGPTNPASIRIATCVDRATTGHTEVTALYNRITGPTKYALMVFAGPQVVVGGGPYSGTIEAAFYGTTLDAAAASSSISVIAFTHTRSLLWPDPWYAPAPLMQGALFDIRGGEELGDVLIDHREQPPEIPPNQLFINGEEIPYQTFAAFPPPVP